MAVKIHSHLQSILAQMVVGYVGFVFMTYLIQKVSPKFWAQGSFYRNSNILGFPYLPEIIEAEMQMRGSAFVGTYQIGRPTFPIGSQAF